MIHPKIIQGGMGVAVSNWRLARAVSRAGQLGVVSGTFLDIVLARRLQDGDREGLIREALARFPFPDIAARVLDRYFIDGGKPRNHAYVAVPMHGMRSSRELTELTLLANFVEVALAKDGHDGVVGINYLTKINFPTLPSLYGAMLAGVDYVLMGAGIPKAIPGILDRLSRHEVATLKVDVDRSDSEDVYELTFNPRDFGEIASPLKRPQFLAIVSSSILAEALLKRSTGKVDGFVVEHHTAGGHNAPPRGGVSLNVDGEPIYGPKDEPSLDMFCRLGAPYWLAGGWASPDKLEMAISSGAAGIQVGTAFAFCQESGIVDRIKQNVIQKVVSGSAAVLTDPLASASGYPFKVIDVEGTLSDPQVYEGRPRICDLGYLRSAYKRADGSVGFRCPAEPPEDYLAKGGRLEETAGRKCLCNGLLSTVGYPQVRPGDYVEPAIVTAGKDVEVIGRLVSPPNYSYSARDVLDFLTRQQATETGRTAASV